jgi:NAD(P)-dependent dehydrogenase (short-subunit alcohol dehydrogenase family)
MNPTPSFFSDKVVVVTGAGGTLCSAIALDLARQGARVALLGRARPPLEAVAATIGAGGGTALVVPCDVCDPAAVEAACAEVEAKFGVAHCLVNGAGGNQNEAVTTSTEFTPAEVAPGRPPELRGFFNLEPRRLASVIETNTLGTMLPCQVFGRGMARLGRGSILNFSSMNSARPLSRVPAYACAKAGIVNFTQWLAAYLAPAGLRVNCVAPGFFVNERSRRILMTPEGGLSARGERVMQHTPQRRFGEAPDLLGAVNWLLNDEQAAFVTGINVAVDGGFLASSGL